MPTGTLSFGNPELLSMLHSALGGDQRLRLGCDKFGIFSARRGDNTNRRILQPCFYGRTHTGTECFVALDLSGLAVRNVCLNFVEFVAHFAIRGLIDYWGRISSGPDVVMAKAKCNGLRGLRAAAPAQLGS